MSNFKQIGENTRRQRYIDAKGDLLNDTINKLKQNKTTKNNQIKTIMRMFQHFYLHLFKILVKTFMALFDKLHMISNVTQQYAFFCNLDRYLNLILISIF